MSITKIRKEDALEYHNKEIPGKIEVVPTKDSNSQRDLALAYSPGVAFPCLEIANNKEDVYKYTAKGNLVAVISDGSAVLGLGNIGPEASKPVMEGKGILFKIFAGIDVFDIELNTENIDAFVNTVKAMEPTFGGINLEDIKAPDCFEIERRLKEEMNIPVMHDDQHGTAIISGAGLLNAVEVVGKKLKDIKVVVSGAGASAISCLKIIIELGVRKENVIVCDSKGVIRNDRDNLSGVKKEFATDADVNTLEEAMEGCDFFLGLSMANVVTPKMLLSMAKDPIVFALANPDPEIDYNLAMETRDDLVMATGRSDFPNQVNNVLGFPFIFRGALDVRATSINEEMKLAAVKAIADLARTPVPDIVVKAYNETAITFGKDYFIPKPFDPRLLTTVTPAVAKAAMDSGVAQVKITDWDAYETSLIKRMGNDDNLLRVLTQRAKQNPKRIVFAEAEDPRILKAAQIALDEDIATPILLGDPTKIKKIIQEHHLSLDGVKMIDPRSEETAPTTKKYAEILFKKRQRRGYNLYEAQIRMRMKNYFGAMMVDQGEADALISGITRNYADTIKPALEIIGTYQTGKKVSSMYLMLTKKGPVFFADTTIIPKPTVEELVDITRLTAESVKKGFNIEPRIAMLSYSNFGTSDDDEVRTVRKAVEILRKEDPELVVDGEIQANIAFNKQALQDNYPFCDLVNGEPNILIFPNLSAANISYKLMQTLGNAEAIGPILLGMKKPVHILQLGSSVREVVNMITIATIDAQG
ncbi:NADP-dependent malic enzyme [Flexithrix dorotheae]|uniref:NADP-dependent malic enzyme n=1 Tax=Flexithrix dorotheae TaxID=70993 RepID=UPI00036D372C|nr:NADP-dependent malic enzyme [Flexithrix dorotheae]